VIRGQSAFEPRITDRIIVVHHFENGGRRQSPNYDAEGAARASRRSVRTALSGPKLPPRKTFNSVTLAIGTGRRAGHYTEMMPHFFFDMLDGDKFIVDEDGQELPDLKAARLESIKSARELTAFAAKEGIDVSHRVFRVRNETGEVVCTMPFREAVQPR
jgi:hypothetical protein